MLKDPDYRPEKMCMAWSMIGLWSLNKHVPGIKAMFQAGTCFWPIILPEHDDGVSPNRFGYMWDLHSAKDHIENARLPEIHAWVAFRIGGKAAIVDFNAGSFRALGCEYLGVNHFHAYQIPMTFWHNADEQLPHGVEYVADPVACEVGYRYAQQAVLLAR